MLDFVLFCAIAAVCAPPLIGLGWLLHRMVNR